MVNKILCNKEDLVNVADSIRAKNGLSQNYFVSELDEAIDNLPAGSSLAVQEDKAITLTENGTYTIQPAEPYDAMSKVDVTVNVSQDSSTVVTNVLIENSGRQTGYPINFIWKANDGWHLLQGWDSSDSLTLENVCLNTKIFTFSAYAGFFGFDTSHHWSVSG